MTRRERDARGRIDWAAARRQLAASEQNAHALREDAARVLAQRAVRLATLIEPEQVAGDWLEVLNFQRGKQRYAIESRFVVEVAKCGRLSRVPGAQPALVGMTNLRGDLLPVFDLTIFGEVASAAPPLVAQLVVLGERSPDFGIVADAVDEVTRLSAASLSEARTVGVLPHAEYVRGIGADGCVLLDGAAILRDRFVFVAKRSSGALLEREAT